MSAFNLSMHNPEALEINPDARNYANINGLQMCYLDEGSGETILFIHGGGASIETWNHQIAALRKNYRIIAPDSRGHGRSGDTARPYSHALHASDMIALLDHLGISKAHIVGWSDGSCFALELALNYPKHVASLFFLALIYDVNGLSPEARHAIKTMSPSDYYPYLITLYEQLSPNSGGWDSFFEKCRPMWASEPQLSLDDIKSINIPAFIAVGTDDEWGDAVQAKQIEKVMPNCKLVEITNGDHQIHMTQPDIINRYIDEHIQRSLDG